MKWWARFFVLLLTVVSISGCWDRREVNDIAFVIAMGLDKEANGLYRISVQVPLVSSLGGPSGGGGGTSGDKAFYVDSALGKTIREANNVIQSRMSRHLYYAHHRVIVIGNQLAKEGISDALDIVSRFPENRLTAYLVMTKGKAIELLQAQPQFERFSGEAMREMVKAETIPVSMKDLAQMLNTPGIDAFLPIFQAVDSHPKGKRKEIQSVGIATFRGDKLRVSYSVSELIGLRWFQKTFNSFSEEVDLGKQERVSVLFLKGKAEIKPIVKEGQIHFDISIYGSAFVVENQTKMNLSEDKNITLIEKKLSQKTTQDAKKVMDEIKKHQTDFVGLGIVLARKYPIEWKKKYRNNWNSELPRITYSIHTKLKVTNIGQTTKNITKEDN